MIKVPPTNAGSALQAIHPLTGGIDGAPIAVSAVAAVSTNIIDSGAFYIISNVPVHFRISDAGTSATTTDPWIPANVPMVFACRNSNRISLIKATGASDGLTWVHACEES